MKRWMESFVTFWRGLQGTLTSYSALLLLITLQNTWLSLSLYHQLLKPFSIYFGSKELLCSIVGILVHVLFIYTIKEKRNKRELVSKEVIFLWEQDSMRKEGLWGGGNLDLYLRKGGGKSKPSGIRGAGQPFCCLSWRWWQGGSLERAPTIEFLYTWGIHPWARVKLGMLEKVSAGNPIILLQTSL